MAQHYVAMNSSDSVYTKLKTVGSRLLEVNYHHGERTLTSTIFYDLMQDV